MPELPEVETERGRLAEAIAGRKILSARIDDARLTRPDDPEAVAALLAGEAPPPETVPFDPRRFDL